MGIGPGAGIEVLELFGLLGVFGVGLLEAWWTHPRPQPPEARVLDRSDANRRCPYCHSEFGSDEQADGAARAQSVCAACQTAHHADCWSDHGGCSVYGCVPTRAQRIRLPEREEAAEEAEELEVPAEAFEALPEAFEAGSESSPEAASEASPEATSEASPEATSEATNAQVTSG